MKSRSGILVNRSDTFIFIHIFEFHPFIFLNFAYDITSGTYIVITHHNQNHLSENPKHSAIDHNITEISYSATMSQQHTSFPLFRTSSQGGGSSNSQHNQISLSQHSSHLQQPTLAAPNRAPNNSPFTNSFSKLHGSFSQGGGGAGLSRPASADRQQFSGSQRPNAFNQHIPSSRLHDTSDTVRPRSFPPKQSIPGMSFSQPTSSQQGGDNIVRVY